jgi:hypothetical protein
MNFYSKSLVMLFVIVVKCNFASAMDIKLVNGMIHWEDGYSLFMPHINLDFSEINGKKVTITSPEKNSVIDIANVNGEIVVRFNNRRYDYRTLIGTYSIHDGLLYKIGKKYCNPVPQMK